MLRLAIFIALFAVGYTHPIFRSFPYSHYDYSSDPYDYEYFSPPQIHHHDHMMYGGWRQPFLEPEYFVPSHFEPEYIDYYEYPYEFEDWKPRGRFIDEEDDAEEEQEDDEDADEEEEEEEKEKDKKKHSDDEEDDHKHKDK